MNAGGEFKLSAFGVVVRVRSNRDDLLNAAKLELETAFGGTASIFDIGGPDHQHSYSFIRDKTGRLVLFLNGKRITSGDSPQKFLRYFNSLVRITVAEHADSRVFVHAGVVGWRGKVLVIPARSFEGKSTLVKALVDCGAEYFSDEYAVIDEAGLVHPFPRPITLRVGQEKMRILDLPPNELGGRLAKSPAPIGCVLFTEYKEGAIWKPEIISYGSGILEMIRHTIPFTREPGYSLKVLNTALNRAIIVRSPRGDAGEFARIILDFIDNRSL
jgi:hypothetical protein